MSDPYSLYPHRVIADDRVLDGFGGDFLELRVGNFRGGNYRELDATTVIDVWSTTWEKAEEGHYTNVSTPFQNGDADVKILVA